MRTAVRTRLRWILLLGAAGLGPGAALAQSGCQEICFARGASSAQFEGEVPAEDVLCYSIKLGAGQQAAVRVTSLSRAQVVARVSDVGDAREAFTWRSRGGRYEILVFQLFRAVAPAPFRLEVSAKGP